MTELLSFRGVSYRYPDCSEPALRQVSLQVPMGKKVVFVGRNGSGKSTLFLHCNGILRPESGIVEVAGRPIRYDRSSLTELRRIVGLVFQNPDDQLFSATVAQDISFGPMNLGWSEMDVRDRVAEAAEKCGVADLLDRPCHALSGGQKMRVALAGVLAMDPSLLIADEVAGNLDPCMRRELLLLLGALAAEGRTVLLATHDMSIARHWADLVVAMDQGTVVAAGDPGVVFDDPAVQRLLCVEDPW